MAGAATTILASVVAFTLLAAGGISGWEYINSDDFCTYACHVHPEETHSHRKSAHARVHCVECHMGRSSTLHLVLLKSTHLREMWSMLTGYERPTHATTLRPAGEACESCHDPRTEHRDSVAVIKRYETDPPSSSTEYRLALRTTTDVQREIPWKAAGVHWHVGSDVEFASSDPQARTILWVRLRNPDGSEVTYVDATTGIALAGSAEARPRRMACYHCHNAAGHPFLNPVDVVDEALASGRIDRSLPGAKARAVALIKAAGGLSGPLPGRAEAVDKLLAENAIAMPAPTDQKELDLKFQEAMREILLANSFTAKGVTWETFPNHAQHRSTPGCFRCHDGKHFNEKGEAIRLQCTLCHDLPQVRLESGGGSVASTVVSGVWPPKSHNEPNFMHDHRVRADASCAACHGELAFGREGGNFCANPACHGRQWPAVDLNVRPAGNGTAPAGNSPQAGK